PSASRMPNSRVRALTENASTPATPTTAIASATAANTPNTTEFRRSGVSTSARTSSRVAGGAPRPSRGRWRLQRQQRPDGSIGIHTGVNKKVAAKEIAVFESAIGSDHGPGNEVFVVDIGGDADDAVRRHETRLLRSRSGNKLQDRVRPVYMTVDGILLGEHAL